MTYTHIQLCKPAIHTYPIPIMLTRNLWIIDKTHGKKVLHTPTGIYQTVPMKYNTHKATDRYTSHTCLIMFPVYNQVSLEGSSVEGCDNSCKVIWNCGKNHCSGNVCKLLLYLIIAER